jgi:F-box protein 21
MSLEQLPGEIIQHLLYYVSPVDNILYFQLVSRRLRELANEPLLWRHHCQSSFRFWNVHHNLPRKLMANVHDVNWRELFLYRHRGNVRMAHFFESVLATQVGRVRSFEQICKAGYDAKDFLLEQYRTPDSADDVLARRYGCPALPNDQTDCHY